MSTHYWLSVRFLDNSIRQSRYRDIIEDTIANSKLMICWISGFESAVLKLPPQKPGKVYPIAPVAFVTFQRKCDAQIAIDKLQGEKFDDEYATTLRLEFAKSNTKNKMKSLKVQILPHLTSFDLTTPNPEL